MPVLPVAPRTSRAPLRDPALPALPRLLDDDAMAPVLERSLGGGSEVIAARGRYLRYKPGTNLRVQYEVTIGGRRCEAVAMIAAEADLGRRAAKPENLAMARAVAGRSPAVDPLVFDPGLGALIQWLPLDLALPGLAEPPARLRRRLRAAGLALSDSDSEPRRLAYKTHRRAVLRLDGHVLKAYATERRYRAAESRLRAASSSLGLPSAAFEAALPELRVTAQRFVHGRKPDSAGGAARLAGAVLRALHVSPVEGLERFPPVRQHGVSAAFGEMVKAIAPHLASRVDGLVGRLGESFPDGAPLVPSHGDFHAGQLLCRRDGPAVIDLDEMSAAPAALDLATFAAHELSGEEGELALARAILEELVEGYGTRPEGLSWYLAAMILRRASHPFRRLWADWPRRVEAMVAAAEEAL
jgi:hypothetical protein